LSSMSEETVDFTFDLSKITLDEALNILELDPGNINPGYMAGLVRSLKKCLVRGSKELTGADLPGVIEAFTTAVMGGGTDSKN
jgi:hypothetical protein